MSRGRTLALAAALFVGAGCRMDMQDQPRYEPDAASAFLSMIPPLLHASENCRVRVRHYSEVRKCQ